MPPFLRSFYGTDAWSIHKGAFFGAAPRLLWFALGA
jgi:hypothetical protein